MHQKTKKFMSSTLLQYWLYCNSLEANHNICEVCLYVTSAIFVSINVKSYGRFFIFVLEGIKIS